MALKEQLERLVDEMVTRGVGFEDARCVRPGDRVAVEDPGFGNIHNLVISHGLSLAPVSIDDEGMLPDALWQACEDGAKALIVTPRAQNPTGAALSAARAVALRTVLRRYPGVLVIEALLIAAKVYLVVVRQGT